MKELINYLNTNNIDFSLDEAVLDDSSTDASIFNLKPKVVIYPKKSSDIEALVHFLSGNSGYNLTPRAGGTDMTGGPLSNSIVLDFTKYFINFNIYEDKAQVEPGVFYRYFDKASRQKGYILPCFPASRDICALGGMIANNAGGEKSLKYGKIDDYVSSLNVVLSDGNNYKIEPLDIAMLQKKMSQGDFEGEIYKKVYNLISNNQKIISQAKPKVSKNSAGYALWNIWDGKIFDLTKLFVGSQGTLGIITSAEIKMIHPQNLSGMLVMFLDKSEYKNIPDIVKSLKSIGAETIEAYDKHTFQLATRYFYDFVKILGVHIISLFWHFLPEILMTIRGGVPDLVILAEFGGDSDVEVRDKVRNAYELLRFKVKRLQIETNINDINKYRAVRRSSYQLLRTKIKNKKPASFIDDLIVSVDKLPEFLPDLEKKLSEYDFMYTVSGHLGDGNFHIIPLLSPEQIKDKKYINKIMTEVYDIVFKYEGSISAEHNDGLLRVNYLRQMYGEEIYNLFVEIKKIFDPKNIFNPGKKIKIDI